MQKFYMFGFYILLLLLIALSTVLMKLNHTKIVGQLAWADLYSNNSTATIAFFSNVFGSTAQKVDMPDNMDYSMLKAKKALFPAVGVMQITDEFREQGLLPHATLYFTVTDYEKTHQKMIKNGAKILRTAMVKNGMKFGIYLIPGDVDIAIIQYGGDLSADDNDQNK